MGKMFFTEFRNRSMSYKESQQQIHVSDHTQTILGEKRKGSSKALMRRTNRIQGGSFLKEKECELSIEIGSYYGMILLILSKNRNRAS